MLTPDNDNLNDQTINTNGTTETQPEVLPKTFGSLVTPADESENIAAEIKAEPSEPSITYQYGSQAAPSYYQQNTAAEQPIGQYQAGFAPYPQFQPNNGYYSAVPQSPNNGKAKKEKKKGITGGKIAAIAVCCSLLGGIVGGAGGLYLADYLKGSNPNLSISDNSGSAHTMILEGKRDNPVLSINSIDTSSIMTQAEVYAANVNSVVGITTSITTNYWGYTTTSAASGSGFILSDTGYIITNFHVIEKSSSITVSLYDGTELDAELVGYDESNDIAVLKVEANDKLVPAVLGSSKMLNVGDEVVAIGNPLGELTFSLTSGYVSALDREITLSSNVTMDLIQTDCAINSGNSGGPLFNLYGEVVGITNAKYSGSGSSTEASIDNIGFAIPIDSVRDIIKSIIEKGYISKPFIGVTVTDVSEETQSYGLPAGAAVKEVTENGPAAKAGLQPNDIITSVDGKAIASSSDLVDIIGESQPDDVLKLDVYRQGRTINLEVTIGEKIQSAMEKMQSDAQSQQQGQQNPDGNEDDQNTNPWGLPDWFFKYGF